VKICEYKAKDLVLKHVIQTTWQKDHWKVRPNWEGPYTIIAQKGKGSYTLADQDGKILKKQWNSFHLKRYCVKPCNIQ